MLVFVRASLFVLAWIGVVSFVIGAAPDKKPLQNLGNGEHLKVSFTSKGCFHYSVHEFDFHRDGDLVVDVAEVVQTWSFGGLNVASSERVPLGSLHLNKSEAASLDRLIAFYRGDDRSGIVRGTTPEGFGESISLKSRQGGKKTEENWENYSVYHGEGLVSFPELAYRLTQHYPRLENVDYELRPQALAAQRVCSAMSGLVGLKDVFKFNSAYVHHPSALSVRLESVTVRLIDTVSWTNPMKGGKAMLDWNDFLGIYHRTDESLAKHEWLGDWKRLYGIRSLELQLQGTKANQSGGEYTTHVLPLWKHEKFSGTPTYCLMARHGYHAWVEIYFSDKDERALIYRADCLDDDPYGDLDKLNLSWDPKGKDGDPSANYAVIDKDGACRVKTFVKSAP